LTHALRRATQSIPIITSVGDPVGSGFAISLQIPGGNVTGLSKALREKAGRQVGLLVEVAPTFRTLLVLRSRRYGDIPELNACLEEAAAEHGRVVEVRTTESFAEVETALESVAGLGTGAAITYGHGASQFDESKLAKAAIRNGVVTIGDERAAAEAGLLMSYSMPHADPERCFASLIDRVLRGESAAKIPFELPAKSELIVNRATAAALGLALSPELLSRADAVIE
jgi:putative ABC transport system substrate-binding protein